MLSSAQSVWSKWFFIQLEHIREVLLHVKCERVRVTSDSAAQTRYTSRSRTLLGFATRRRIGTSKWHDNSPLNTFANKIERTLPNDILHRVEETIGYN